MNICVTRPQWVKQWWSSSLHMNVGLEWVINYIPCKTMQVITYPCPNPSYTMLVKGAPCVNMLTQFIRGGDMKINLHINLVTMATPHFGRWEVSKIIQWWPWVSFTKVQQWGTLMFSFSSNYIYTIKVPPITLPACLTWFIDAYMWQHILMVFCQKGPICHA